MKHSPSLDLGTRTHLGLKAALWEVNAYEPKRLRNRSQIQIVPEIDHRSKLCLNRLQIQTVLASLTVLDPIWAIRYRGSCVL